MALDLDSGGSDREKYIDIGYVLTLEFTGLRLGGRWRKVKNKK